MKIFSKASYTSSPWKNGGGVTHEAIRVPSNGEFRWRVSLAEVASSGPFSDFTGYNRTMVLLSGAGVKLTFADGRHTQLTQPGALAQFDGAVATHCELILGPCVDLNLMVTQSLDEPRVWLDRVAAARCIDAPSLHTLLLVVIAGDLTVEMLSELCPLHAGDMVVAAPGERLMVAPLVAGGVEPLIFCALIDETRDAAASGLLAV